MCYGFTATLVFVRRLLCAALVLLMWSTAGQAANFEVRRAISMDQWVTWPDSSRWNDDAIIDIFPEWRGFVSFAEIVRLRRAGFDTVRLPIDPAMFLFSDNAERQSRLMTGVDLAVERLLAAGLKVIVDLHTIPRSDGSPALGIEQILDNQLQFKGYRQLVSTMAGHLDRYGANTVALELINEPTSDCDSQADRDQWHRQLSELHQAARSANGAITLVLAGACWGSAAGLAAVDPTLIGDDNVLWTFHHYEPFHLTHQSADWAGPQTQHLSGIPYPPSQLTDAEANALKRTIAGRIGENLGIVQAQRIASNMRNDIDDLRRTEWLRAKMAGPFDQVAAWADTHGIARNRIFLGEFGMIGQEYGKPPATKPAWRVAYIKDMISLAEGHGFGWSLWSFGGAFGLVQGFGGDPQDAELIQSIVPRS